MACKCASYIPRIFDSQLRTYVVSIKEIPAIQRSIVTKAENAGRSSGCKNTPGCACAQCQCDSGKMKISSCLCGTNCGGACNC